MIVLSLYQADLRTAAIAICGEVNLFKVYLQKK